MLNFNTSSPTNLQKSHKIDLSPAGHKHALSDKGNQIVSPASSRTLKRGLIRAVALGIVLVGLIITVRGIYHHVVYAGIDTNRYQAVYLTNGNVYFGRVHIMLNGSILLTDSFRVEAASSTSTKSDGSSSTSSVSSSNSNSDIRLIKPGKELHAPDDTMLINRDNMLFIENLKVDGKVTQAIIQYHKENTSN